MATDPTTALAIIERCRTEGLLRSSREARAVWRVLHRWERWHSRNPGKRFEPKYRLVYALQDPVTGHIRIGRSNNPLQRGRVGGSHAAVRAQLLYVSAERLGPTESELHRRFKRWRVPGTDGWYFPVPDVTRLVGGEIRRVMWDASMLIAAIRRLEAEMTARDQDQEQPES